MIGVRHRVRYRIDVTMRHRVRLRGDLVIEGVLDRKNDGDRTVMMGGRRSAPQVRVIRSTHIRQSEKDVCLVYYHGEVLKSLE